MQRSRDFQPYMQSLWWLCLALCIGACSDSVEGGADACATDEECDGGRCIAARCTSASDLPATSSESDARLPGTHESTTSGSDGPSRASSRETTSRPGGYLDPCVRDADCESNVCISSPLGRVCTRPCALDEDCAPAAGWRCQLIAGERDLVRVCYPDATNLCEPCEVDTDCGGIRDLCLWMEDGQYCGLDCRAGALCPVGYTCVEDVSDAWVQCVPDNNRCDDCEGADLLNDPEHCGRCGNVCEFAQGAAQCTNGTCNLAACDLGWDNCDGDPSTGCETPVDADPENCGACDVVCPASGGVPICVEGECDTSGCASGEILCEGSCRAPNGCGGCADLPATPDVDACGACDTGVWQCDGASPDALVCVGETDPLSDDRSCGEACVTCAGGQTCQSGVCACPQGQILCEGVCRSPNVCGGCASLGDVIPGSSCGSCGTGTQTCSDVGTPAATLRCEGETSTGSDPNHCGSCNNRCPEGAACVAGVCACPDNWIVCEGVCQMPNACGGCGILEGAPEGACGACLSGQWACVEGNANAVTCVGEADTSSDADFCGDACAVCEGGRICEEGTCTCPGDQIPCADGCRTPNACGGCAVLVGKEDDLCGLCGTLVCSGGDLVCVGESEGLESDPENCGACGVTCDPGVTCSGGVCGCGPDHLGIRSDAASAWPLMIGELSSPAGRRGALDDLQLCAGDAHWYRLDVPARGGEVRVELGGECAGSFAPTLELVNASGGVVASSTGGGAGGCPRLTRDLDGGTRYLRVRAPSGQEGRYDLQVSWDAILEQEPNDNWFQANGPYHRDMEFSGQLDAEFGDPRDMFELRLRHAGVFTFETFLCGARTRVRLRNSAGAEIVTGSGSFTCSTLTLPLRPGTYFVEVEQIGGDREYGSYRLRSVGAPVFAAPPMATPAQATALGTLPTGGEGAIRGGDADYWRVSVPSFGPLIVETRGYGRDCDLNSEIALLSVDGQTLIASATGGGPPATGGGACAVLRPETHPALAAIAAGDYLIRVRGEDGARGPYLLNAFVP